MGEVLAEVWNMLVMVTVWWLVNTWRVLRGKSYPVAYEEQWVTKHCRISQYFLQILKCTDEKCCDPFWTNWLDVFPCRFLLAPVQFRQSTGGPTVPLSPQAKSAYHFADLWKRTATYELVTQNDYEVLPYKVLPECEISCEKKSMWLVLNTRFFIRKSFLCVSLDFLNITLEIKLRFSWYFS